MRTLPGTTPSRPAQLLLRILLAGPASIIVALTLLAGMPLWLPAGPAGVDNLVIPLVFAPLIWAALFFHACLDRSLARVALIAGALLVVHGGLIAAQFIGGTPVSEKAR
jgi:hypothetical protein